MILEFINLFFMAWLYFYLIKLTKLECKCALTPNYYFVVFYICFTFVLIALSGFADLTDTNWLYALAGLKLVYFMVTIGVIVVIFGYVKQLESANCDCVTAEGRLLLEIFAWLRILSFVVAIVTVIYVINNFSVVNARVNSAKAA